MALPNTSLLRLPEHVVMHDLPPLARSRILQYAATQGGTKHLCPMVEKECARNLPTLDCSLDATWRELTIDIFGGPHASQIYFIDRWFNESNAHEIAEGRPAMTWRLVFQQLCSLYRINYLAMKNGTPLVTASKWMLGVFPLFREFPGAIITMARPDYVPWPGLRPTLYYSRNGTV